MKRFANWCIMGGGWWYWRWDMSWVATTYIGAVQENRENVALWSKPAFEAFVNGADSLYWTEDTLYWVAKPSVALEVVDSQKRLHCEDGPALRSDVEDSYFWHGVLVPWYVVEEPERITVKEISDEENAEVRRVMMERMGWNRFCLEAQMKTLHEDTLTSHFPAIPVSDLIDAGQRLVTTYRQGTETAQLLEASGLKDFDDRPLRFVRLTDPSTGRQYTIRVRHDHRRCYEAIGWTFGMSENEYKSGKYIRQGDVGIISIGPTVLPHQQHS